METLELVKPAIELNTEYLAFVDERLASGEEDSAHLRAVKAGFPAYVRRLQDEEKGLGLPAGYVPQTTYWLVRNGTDIVGESRLRHHLTPALKIEGGHIGYSIRPSERRKGYGTRILALTMEKAREMGLTRVLVTCDTHNIGSAKIIRKNGGVFAGEDVSPWTGKMVSRYWIEL